eukprot:13719400-Alexandrium_andersonii.AAC.1
MSRSRGATCAMLALRAMPHSGGQERTRQICPRVSCWNQPSTQRLAKLQTTPSGATTAARMPAGFANGARPTKGQATICTAPTLHATSCVARGRQPSAGPEGTTRAQGRTYHLLISAEPHLGTLLAGLFRTCSPRLSSRARAHSALTGPNTGNTNNSASNAPLSSH